MKTNTKYIDAELRNQVATEHPVNINSELYNEILKIVEANPIEFSSVKKFIEIGARNYIYNIRFNIENMHEIISKDGLLIVPFNTGFTKCGICDGLFLKAEMKNKKGPKVCNDCLKFLKNLINQSEQNE